MDIYIYIYIYILQNYGYINYSKNLSKDIYSMNPFKNKNLLKE